MDLEKDIFETTFGLEKPFLSPPPLTTSFLLSTGPTPFFFSSFLSTNFKDTLFCVFIFWLSLIYTHIPVYTVDSIRCCPLTDKRERE